MFLFILLAVLLIAVITLTVIFPVLTKRMSNEKYISLCENKIKSIAKRKHLLSLVHLSLQKYNREKLNVDNIIFGKKFIYLISPVKLKGFVIGSENDKSWIHYNTSKKNPKYINNLNVLSNKNMQEFAGNFGINPDFIVSICLIPNNCDFSISGEEQNTNHIVHYSSLGRKIARLEKQRIASLDKQQICEEYGKIKQAHEDSKR